MTDTAALLEALMEYFKRFVVLTDDQLLAVSLWALHTHVFDAFTTTPYLIVTSAEPRSGKSRLAIECMGPVVPNPKTMVGLTAAVLFRIVSQAPTLLIDETDAVFKDSKFGPSEKQEDIRSILNAGYRKGVTVPRCAPGTNEIIEWPVYGPKALAGIGHLPVTIEDRGLCIRLSRRMPDEIIERFRYETGIEWGNRLKPGIEAWAPGARILLHGARPVMPDELDDRAQDAYEVLIAIADMAGAEWGVKARAALLALRGADSTVKESLGVKLFRDMEQFVHHLTMERIPTKDFISWLYQEGDEPWEDWWEAFDGKKAARRLALIFAEYGVKHVRWREAGERFRGYLVVDILRARERYTWNDLGHLAHPSSDAGLRDTQHGPGEKERPKLESADLQGKAQVPMLVPTDDSDGTENLPISDWEW